MVVRSLGLPAFEMPWGSRDQRSKVRRRALTRGPPFPFLSSDIYPFGTGFSPSWFSLWTPRFALGILSKGLRQDRRRAKFARTTTVRTDTRRNSPTLHSTARTISLSVICLMVMVTAAIASSLPVPFQSYALVQDDGTLLIRGQTVRLFGIYIPPTEYGCRANFRPPRCGSRAVRALKLKIQGFVQCVPQAKHQDGSISATCYVENDSLLNPPVDLGAWLIEQGFAVARPEAPFEYTVLEKIARVNRRGVWGFQVDVIR
jgi:endonuclease YncB( thermonuclease family)